LDLPSQYVHDFLNMIMWPNHPLGRLLLGKEETVNNFSQKMLLEFKDKWYAANNTLIAVAGNVSHDEVVKEAQSYFYGLSTKKTGPFLPVEEKQVEPKIQVLEKGTEQSHLCLGIRALKRDDTDRYVFRILNTILGANMSSRLFQEVREKHSLAYEIHSSINRYADTGALVVSAGVETTKLSAAIDIIMKELAKLKDEFVPEEELKRAKEYFEGMTLMSMEKTMSNMNWIGETVLTTGSILTKEAVIQEIRKVTIEDIKRLALKIFVDKNINVALIGPVKDEVPLLSNLHF